MSQQTDTSVRRTVTVRASQERAFRVYTDSFGAWWPKEHHIGTAELADVTFEPRVGGRWFETGVDGSECGWGRVLVWDPPHRLVHTWQLQGDWQYDADPARASEVEVRFVAQGHDSTRVEVEHTLFERHGDGAASVRDSVSSPQGYAYCLRRYVELVDAG